MAKVFCSNCGAEVILPEKSETVTSTTISKESEGEYIMPTKTTNNTNTKENNMNEFNFELLAKMVAEQLKGDNMIDTSTSSEVTLKDDANTTSTFTDKFDTVATDSPWAKGSKYYGKVIYGYVFNPYMIRYHLTKKYMELYNDYDTNVHYGINDNYDYMYSVNHTIKEINKLALLAKKDTIAFEERMLCFNFNSCQKIISDYIDNCIKYLEDDIKTELACSKAGNSIVIYVPTYGNVNAGEVKETISNHKIINTLDKSVEYLGIINRLENDKRNVNNIWYYSGYSNSNSKKCYIKLAKIVNSLLMIKIADTKEAPVKKSKEFMECYIKSGAYYTLKSKIMFEDRFFKGANGELALKKLRLELENNDNKGYIFHALLKEMLGN